ncbi:hypothetical protein DFQ28_000952 [Apophysomyces sp. BC1034]|nr:hypothetical protein DFQ29_006892 [Apophysomyces sp. BC1021]KAG0194233.1 hypothetical protein DFQ28_000952 [Apophysomyces sp. BC1034]
MTETISQGVDVIQDGVKGRRGVKSSQSCVLDSSTVTQAIPNVGFKLGFLKKRTAESPILSSDAPSRVELARALLDNDRRRETQRKSRSVTPPLSPSCIQPSQETPDLDWENCMEEVSRRMTDLFNAYASPACSNVQLMVFHIASSVRVLLQSTTHSLTDGHYAFPDEGQQRKAVLRALSKLIQKSTALQESAQVKADEQLRALANHLWMETLVFEEILQATISRKETLMTLEKASRSVQPKKPKQPLPDTDYVVRRLQYHRTSIEDLVADDLAAIFNKVDEEVSFSNKEIDRVKSLLLRNITELISMVESLSRQWREKKDTPTNNENSVAEIDTRHAPELEIDHITRREDRIINVSQQQENEPGTSNSVTDESFGTSSTGSSLSSFSSSASLISDELPDIRRSLKRSSLEIASLTPSTSMKSAGTVPDRKATKTSATPSRLSIQHSSVSSVIFSHRPTLPHPTVICSKSTPVMDKAATTRRRGRSISTLRISRKPMRIDLRPSSSASAFDTTTPNSFRGRLSSPLWLKRKSIGPVKSDAAEKVYLFIPLGIKHPNGPVQTT